MERNRLVGLVCLLLSLAVPSLASAESRLPDHDGSNLNNTFETAQTVDVLRLEGGEPRGIHIAQELGKVVGGFDTTDYYKFVIPNGTRWKLGFFMKEWPDTTVAIKVFRNPDRANEIAKGQGNAFEQFDLFVDAGTYYVQVFTSRDAARDRLLHYDVAIGPVFVPTPDKGGPSCASARNIGVNPNGRVLEGSLSPAAPLSAYSFHLTGDTRFHVSRRHGQFSNVVELFDRNSGERFLLAEDGRPRDDLNYLIDPGFYCVLIRKAGPNTANYAVELLGPASNRRPDRVGGASLRSYDVGNLTSNGRYKTPSRYLAPTGEPSLIKSAYVVIREWIEPQDFEQRFHFRVPELGRLNVKLTNLKQRVGLSVLDASGEVIATGQQTGSETSPRVLLETPIEPGNYQLRLTTLSAQPTGTDYQAIVHYLP